MNLNSLLNKLDNIAFTACDDLTLSNEDWSVKIKFTFDNATETQTPINTVLSVYHKNVRAYQWGCTNENDINAIRLWFVGAKNAIRTHKMIKQDHDRMHAENLFIKL